MEQIQITSSNAKRGSKVSVELNQAKHKSAIVHRKIQTFHQPTHLVSFLRCMSLKQQVNSIQNTVF